MNTVKKMHEANCLCHKCLDLRLGDYKPTLKDYIETFNEAVPPHKLFITILASAAVPFLLYLLQEALK